MNYENLVNLMNETKALIEENERLTKEIEELKERGTGISSKDLTEEQLEEIADSHEGILAKNDNIITRVIENLNETLLDQIATEHASHLAGYNCILEEVVHNLKYEVGNFNHSQEIELMKELMDYHSSEAYDKALDEFKDDLISDLQDDIKEKLEEEIKEEIKDQIRDFINDEL